MGASHNFFLKSLFSSPDPKILYMEHYQVEIQRQGCEVQKVADEKIEQ
jgi:hypothetical protein